MPCWHCGNFYAAISCLVAVQTYPHGFLTCTQSQLIAGYHVWTLAVPLCLQKAVRGGFAAFYTGALTMCLDRA